MANRTPSGLALFVILSALLVVGLGADGRMPGALRVLHAEEAPAPASGIAWVSGLKDALATAKAEKKITLVCVNAKFVDGTQRVEPAAKGLREVVYRDARVVARSKKFLCVLLTPESSSDDYGELRSMGIEGSVVSPQHIFIHPSGNAVLTRREYWSFGFGERGVSELIAMMDAAEKKLHPPEEGAGAEPEENDAAMPPNPAEAELAPGAQHAAERAAWITRTLLRVVESGGEHRKGAIKKLVDSDAEGDCLDPLLALLGEHKKDPELLVAIVRGVGRDGLVRAAEAVVAQLKHKDAAVRANAAVSLEYIGCRHKKTVAALRKALDKAKDEVLANHLARALGRCGVDDSKARAVLLKRATSSKNEFLSYGPCMGLAYFEGDAKAARGVEKILKLIGVPGSRRGGGQNTVKRGLVSWTLACIGDLDSGTFLREELMARLKNVKAFWVGGLTTFWDTVARCCEGERGLLVGIEAGVGGFVQFAQGAGLGRYGAEVRALMDDARKGRDNTKFKPLGDGLLGGGP